MWINPKIIMPSEGNGTHTQKSMLIHFDKKNMQTNIPQTTHSIWGGLLKALKRAQGRAVEETSVRT